MSRFKKLFSLFNEDPYREGGGNCTALLILRVQSTLCDGCELLN